MDSSDILRRCARPHRLLPFRIKHGVRNLAISLIPHLSYSYWVKHGERPVPDASQIARAIDQFVYKPKISIVMPVYNTPLEFLDSAIRSVLAQHYTNWELCICDDASPDADVRCRLHEWEMRDRRIIATYSLQNEGISGASNRALELASGDFVGLLDHDDELTPDALFEVVNLLQERPDADMIYSDEDRLDGKGRRTTPNFKPDWSPEYFLSVMYTCHFGVYRRRLVDQIGRFRIGFEGSQDYDLVLRLSEKTHRIYHIPKILYHWRMALGSTAAGGNGKPYATEAGKRALNEHLMRRRIPGEVIPGNWPGHYRMKFANDEMEKVSIVISSLGTSKLLRDCVRSIEERTSHCNYELIVSRDKRLDPRTSEWLLSRGHKVIFVDEPSRISRLVNRGAAQASGDYVLLLHDDTEVISSDWIRSMLGFCRQEQIGATGAKLLYRTRRIQDIGIVLGLKGFAGHPLRGFRAYPLGWPDPSEFARNCSAVSAACLMVRRELFEKLGGFDEQMPGTLNDVDFCLRLRAAGYRIVWTPEAELYHDDSDSCLDVKGSEVKFFVDRWGATLGNDPYYNPNLTLRYDDIGYRV